MDSAVNDSAASSQTLTLPNRVVEVRLVVGEVRPPRCSALLGGRRTPPPPHVYRRSLAPIGVLCARPLPSGGKKKGQRRFEANLGRSWWLGKQFSSRSPHIALDKFSFIVHPNFNMADIFYFVQLTLTQLNQLFC